jgi:cell division protein FtsN
MTVGRNLSRARSHIIFIVALLAASAYILWVESSRREAAASRAPEAQWRVEFGAFDNAAAAGRQWDGLRGRLPELRGAEVSIIEGADGVRLELGPLSDQRQAVQICGAVQAGGAKCRLVSPGP